MDGRCQRKRFRGCACPEGPPAIIRARTKRTPNREPVCLRCRGLLGVSIEGGHGVAPAVIHNAATRMEKRFAHKRWWRGPDPALNRDGKQRYSML